MVPPRLARKMSVMSVGTTPPLGSRTNSGGTRSPARFAAPRGRGGDRGVPRGCREPAAPLGPAGGAGSAHPLRTRRLGRGARGGLGLRQGACPYSGPSAGAELLRAKDERAYRRSFSPTRPRKRVADSLLLRCSSSKSTRRPPKSPIHSRESRKRGGAGSSRPEPADPQRGRASLT